jgi:hypothetical protein
MAHDWQRSGRLQRPLITRYEFVIMSYSYETCSTRVLLPTPLTAVQWANTCPHRDHSVESQQYEQY